MRRFLLLLLILALTIGLWACGSNTPEPAAPEPAVPVIPFSEDFPEDLRQYAAPWDYDVTEAYKEDGRVHYFFMSSNGLFMSEAELYPYKWGDACLILLPGGTTILVDSGMDTYAPVLVENLKRMGITRLDYVIISHMHNDHMHGALTEGGVLEIFPVGQVIWNGVYNGNWTSPKWLEAYCTRLDIPCAALGQGDRFKLGSATMEVLWPRKDLMGSSTTDSVALNNNSLVFRLMVGEHSSLFTGDLYAAGEAELLRTYKEKLEADLIKAPHHGHDTSGTLEFVMAVAPKLAVATGYATVSAQTKGVYEAIGATMLNDRENGYIHVTADADSIAYATNQTRKKGADEIIG